MSIAIYELRDPRDLTCSPRYIGITKKPLEKRLARHLWEALNIVKRNHRVNWIKKLIEEGVNPTIHLIEYVETDEESYEAEKYWIKEFKVQGYGLTNNHEGGQNFVKMTPEILQIRSQIHKGKSKSPETRKKLSEALKGKKKVRKVYAKRKPTSEETKRKISEAQKGIKCPTRGKRKQ